jgi:hypothetical protein
MKTGAKIDRRELAICKRRGHDQSLLREDWKRCKWCGMWLREVTTIEESEQEPPKEEQSPLEGLEAMIGERNARRAKKPDAVKKQRGKT